jgi:DNA-binding winged helix-turn-helix (wHTH) protein
MGPKAHSGGDAEPALNARFGPFELDLRGGELRKEGRRIRLQEQPFQILRMLIESPGEVISREDIRKRLWPDNTVVEFDHSINAAVKRLRDALRDSADKPRYIETVARRGYRFIADIEPPTHQAPLAEPITVVPPPTEPTNAQQAKTPLPRAEAVPRPPLFEWSFLDSCRSPGGDCPYDLGRYRVQPARPPGWGRSPSTPHAPGSRARKRSSNWFRSRGQRNSFA